MVEGETVDLQSCELTAMQTVKLAGIIYGLNLFLELEAPEPEAEEEKKGTGYGHGD